jgi:hypothetical protein
MTRILATFSVRSTPVTLASPTTTPVHLEQLITRWVRRIAWGGDGRKGSARIELGAGALAGAVIVVQADAGQVSIDIDLPPDADASAWRDRLRERLNGRGLSVAELTVR